MSHACLGLVPGSVRVLWVSLEEEWGGGDYHDLWRHRSVSGTITAIVLVTKRRGGAVTSELAHTISKVIQCMTALIK